MPKELAGFYFDPEKNRYFPLSSSRKRPSFDDHEEKRGSTSASVSSSSLAASRPTIVRRPLSAKGFGQKLLSHSLPLVTERRSLVNHEILNTRIASTSLFDLSPASTFGDITEFCSATSDNGITRRYLGDNKGWLYACTSFNHSTQDALAEDNHLPSAQMYMWPPEINLHSNSQISSINISGQKCITTCFGPVTKVAVQDLNVSGRTTLITLHQVHDVRASNLKSNELILGAKGKAVYIPDIDISGSIRNLNNRQNSDVFAIDRDEHLVYIGARNGSIIRHDLRVPPDKLSGRWLSQSGFAMTTTPSPVLYLKLLQDSQILVSQMNGEFCLYDTRFPLQNSPTRTLRGHRNSFSPKLGICTDPAEDFVFAAGDDCRIRGWSLHTGKALRSDAGDTFAVSTYNSTSSDFNNLRNPFKARFPAPVSTMQITEESGNLCLWAGSQQTLYRYFLGQFSLD